MATTNEPSMSNVHQNGAGAAAILAAGIGCAALGVFTLLSDAFEGMTRVRKQQAVYACIQQFIADGSLHAVTIRALTPAETA